MWLLAMLIAWPLVEITLFVTLGAWLGLWLTLAVVVGTAFAGVAILRSRGSRAGADLRAAMDARRSPGSVVAGEVLTAMAAVFLILPGFLTDTLGVLLLLPPVRRLIVARIAERARRSARAANEGAAWDGDQTAEAQRRPGVQVIDGTWEEIPEAEARRPGSGWTRH